MKIKIISELLVYNCKICDVTLGGGRVSEMWPPVTRTERGQNIMKFVWRNLWMAPKGAKDKFKRHRMCHYSSLLLQKHYCRSFSGLPFSPPPRGGFENINCFYCFLLFMCHPLLPPHLGMYVQVSRISIFISAIPNTLDLTLQSVTSLFVSTIPRTTVWILLTITLDYFLMPSPSTPSLTGSRDTHERHISDPENYEWGSNIGSLFY